MRLAFFRPAADSIAHRLAKDGKVRYTMLFNLVWVVWVFGDVLFNNHIDGAWILATSICVGMRAHAGRAICGAVRAST